MSFPVPWLRLREPFDHRARSEALGRDFVAALPDTAGPWHLLELAGGLGSGVRWLRGLLSRPARFTLIDHDEALLAHVDPGLATPLRADVRDPGAWPDRVDGVQLQALLDLVDLGFLVELADAVSARRVPVLAGLTVDGRVAFAPAHPDDAAVHAAFRVHQLGDRGFGDSVGPHAAAIFADLLRVRGFTVTEAVADWVVDPGSAVMLRAMVEGTAQAAGEVGPRGVDVGAWAEARLSAIREGRLSLRVGHRDVLGRPGRG